VTVMLKSPFADRQIMQLARDLQTLLSLAGNSLFFICDGKVDSGLSYIRCWLNRAMSWRDFWRSWNPVTIVMRSWRLWTGLTRLPKQEQTSGITSIFRLLVFVHKLCHFFSCC